MPEISRCRLISIRIPIMLLLIIPTEGEKETAKEIKRETANITAMPFAPEKSPECKAE